MYAIRYKELVKKDEGINNNMAKKRDKKNKLRGKWLRGIIIVYLLLILCNLFHEFPSRLGNLHSIPVSEEWYLIVVNRWNEIPEDYRVELTELSNGQKVDSRIYPYLQEMFDAARKDGIYPVVREGYRTYDEQQKILDDKIKAYINEGYSQSRAERTAKEWVALPGTSEHQLGIAVDINADKSKSSNDEVYTWLAANAHNYGFILRYPQGKQEITGTSYEPWHYRYVGVDRLAPISIGGSIRGISGLCFHHTISKRYRLQRQLLRLHLLGILIRLSFDAGTGSGAVIQHMTNVLLVAIKLEQERKCCKLHLGVFNQHSLGI